MQAIVFQLAVSGIAMGFVYALVAIEYTLIWNACGMLNFSHEKVIALGGYIFVGTCLFQLHLPNIPAVILGILLMGLFGVIIALVIFIPLSNRTRLIAVIATVMLGQIINESVVLIWGAVALMPSNFLSGVYQIFGATISKSYIFIIVISIVIIALLQFILKRTKVGKAMTCVSINKSTSALMGINVKVSIAITLAISFMICGVIGTFTAPIFTVKQQMATMIALKGFCAGVIGGFGNLPAAIAGGLFLGVLENMVGLAIPIVFKDVFAFALMIVFMMFFPDGMVGVKNRIQKALSKEEVLKGADAV